MRIATIVSAAVAAAGLATVAQAQVISFSGVVSASSEQTGSNFSGDLEYVHLGGASGQLTINLSNETSASVGGFMTGLIFRAVPVDSPLGGSLASANPATFLNTGASSGGGFGMFDGGAALNGNFLGGGTPSFGIGMGGSGQFVFDITSTDAPLLTSASFLGTDAEPGLLIRFRGLTGGGSDMVPVPAPASVALFGLGGLMASRRRR